MANLTSTDFNKKTLGGIKTINIAAELGFDLGQQKNGITILRGSHINPSSIAKQIKAKSNIHIASKVGESAAAQN